jgi:hypothetical protein
MLLCITADAVARTYRRRTGTAPLFLLSLFTCIAPVESAVTVSAAVGATLDAVVDFCIAEPLIFYTGLALTAAKPLLSIAHIIVEYDAHPGQDFLSDYCLAPMARALGAVCLVPATCSACVSNVCNGALDILLQHLHEHNVFVTAVAAGDGLATTTYWYCSSLLVTLSVLLPLCAEWQTEYCLAIPAAVIAATALFSRAPTTTLPGFVVLVVLQLSLVIGQLAGMVPDGASLLPMPVLIVYSVAAYPSARRLPPLGASCRALGVLILLGLLPLTVPGV